MAEKNKITKRFMHLLEYGTVRFLEILFSFMPLKAVYGIIKLLGLFVFYVIRIRRDVTMKNLRNALGNEYSEKELRKIARDAYISIGMSFIEMLFISRFKGYILDFVKNSNLNILQQSIDKERGVILVSCHFGNWELAGAVVSSTGVPVTVVGKRQSNPYTDRFILQNREKLGVKSIYHGVSIKHLVKALKKHEIIGLVSDQDAGTDGIFIDFFGRKASTPGGAAQLALKYNAPIVVIMMVRTGNGKYKCFLEEIDIGPDDTIASITQRFTTVMENIIRQHPEQYFWMHRRWKTVPPDEA